MKNKIFISYSHKDIAVVTKFVQQLSLCGFDLWIDEKDVEIGSNYTTQIFSGIYDSDVYMVFISHNSVESVWVKAEIDFALTRKIEGGKLQIIPVKLDDVEVPISLKNIDFLDARFSINNAIAQVAEKFRIDPMGAVPLDCVSIANIGFTIANTTDVEIGPFNDELTNDDLVENRTKLLEDMRKKAYGILMNFVAISDFDFTAATPKFMNGIYTEYVTKIGGSTVGSIREKISIETTVFQPDETKVFRLLNERLDILNINAITFGFIIPLNEGESVLSVGKKCYQKLQDDYIILSYDSVEGARIELTDDFYLSLCVTEEIIKIKLSTKYDFQFAKRIKEFSVMDFLKTLIER